MEDSYVLGEDVPEVPECYGTGKDLTHRVYDDDGRWTGEYAQFCDQCRGDHRHEWVSARVVLLHPSQEERVVIRCLHCGGRKCDLDCLERRHHRGPHMTPEGTFRLVGS